MKVRKAVITAAGRGTRFLPITKTQPKEMLPLISKPMIQHSVEEAVSSGIEQIVIVTAQGKQAMEDYFDRAFELEYVLEQAGKVALLEEVRRVSALADIGYIRQKEQLGLGHAVLTAKDLVGNEPFAVLLPDDIIYGESPALKQMVAVYEQYQVSVVAVERIELQDTVKYGIIKPEAVSARVHRVLGLVEKPPPAQAPSNLGVVGRYILTPEVFDVLESTPPGKNGEIQLTDALQLLLQKQAIYACEFEGVRYDTGTPLGWLKAAVAFALKQPAIRSELEAYLRQLL